MSRYRSLLSKLSAETGADRHDVHKLLCLFLADDDLLAEFLAVQARPRIRPHDNVWQFFPATGSECSAYWGHCDPTCRQAVFWLPEPNEPSH